jgi:hypothetical protein
MAVSRSAGSVSLSRNPLAPARSAAKTYSSRSNVVKMSARTSVLCVICLVASMPSMTGMRTSIKMTSGLVRRAASTASTPLPASPTTVNPGVAAMIPQNPTRTRAWSSATTTRSESAPLMRCVRAAEAAGCARSPGTRSRAAARR